MSSENKNESYEQPSFQRIERTAHSPELLNAAYGEVINRDDVKTIIDVGAGDSLFAADRQENHDQTVTRVDQNYAYDPPEGDDWLADDARELDSFADEQFDAAVSSYMLQHLDKESQAAALEQMIRVTKQSDGHVGFVGVFPVYKGYRLRKALQQHGLDDVAGVAEPKEDFSGGNLHMKRLEQPTLWIAKNENLDKKKQEELLAVVTESGALSRRKRLSDIGHQVMMTMRGSNRIDTEA